MPTFKKHQCKPWTIRVTRGKHQRIKRLPTAQAIAVKFHGLFSRATVIFDGTE